MPERVHFNFRKSLSRRAFVRGAGVALTLPWLDAMTPAFARTPQTRPRRFVCVSHALGFYAPNLFPEQTGHGYKPPLYLQQIPDVLGDMTVFSGTSHPGVGGGHSSEASILNCVPVTAGGAARSTISLDQLMAKRLGGETRFRSLVLNATGESSPCYTDSGAMIPAESSPARLFARLFVEDTPAEHNRQMARLREGRSIMDLVGEDAKALQRELGAGDRDKLDSYFSSVRDLEAGLAASETWSQKPKPKVNAQPPQDTPGLDNVATRERTMADVMFLALQTDSSRFITLHSEGVIQVQAIPGVKEGYHSLTHHGLDDSKIRQLALIEKELIRIWGEFVRKLKQTQEGAATLLDTTGVMLVSNLGNASSHDTKNMPVLLAGAGFRHGQHLSFDRNNNYPLPNLYVQVLQRLGIETRSFGSSTGESVPGFEAS
jgi:hypothetical protein